MNRGLSLAALRLACGGWVALSAFAGCGEEPRAVSLVRLTPEAAPDCGAPLDARTLRIEALGDFGRSDQTARSVEIGLGDPIAIDTFPNETRALEVEVLGAGGQLAIGRSEEFSGADLADGGEIRVLMAPPNGACPTGPPARARSGALTATSGDTVVVVGGVDAAGTPVSRPEVYLSREARFVEIPQDLYGDVEDGLVGASLTPLPDGRIALIGGGQNAFQVYTPGDGRFSEPPLLLQQARAFHAAVAIDDEQVFLAGGCTMVEAGGCAAGSEAITTAILRIETGELSTGPSLQFVRVGGQAFLESDGRVIIVGGSNNGAPVLTAERIDPQNRQPSEALNGTGQVGVRLASGAIVTAFGPAGAPDGSGTAFAPSGTVGDPLASAGARAEPTLTALESGRVLAFGGGGGTDEAMSEAALFEPVRGRWIAIDALALQTRRRHSSALLPDGSVLIVGGETASGEHIGGALIFRPNLLGPLTGEISINFADESADQLVPRDRGAITIVESENGNPAFLSMDARATDEGIPGEWAIVAAPLLSASEIELTVSGDAGFAVLTAFEEPTTFRVTLIAPGAPISVLDVQAGNIRVLDCSGETLADELGSAQRWRHETTTDRIRLFLGEREMLDCDADIIRQGRVGFGALGASGSELRLFQATVTR